MSNTLPSLAKPAYIFGNAVLVLTEACLRVLSLYSDSGLLAAVPSLPRFLFLRLSELTFTYCLMQFLALFCLFLLSAFIQVTIAFADTYSNPLQLSALSDWLASLGSAWETGFGDGWVAPAKAALAALLTELPTAATVGATVMVLWALISGVWTLVWDSAGSLMLLRTTLIHYMRPWSKTGVNSYGTIGAMHPPVLLLAFLSLPALTLCILLSPVVCPMLEPLDLGATTTALRFVCKTNPLYSRAATMAAFVCWAQWLHIAMFLESKWTALLRGWTGAAFGWCLTVLTTLTALYIGSSYICDMWGPWGFTASTVSGVANAYARTVDNATSPFAFTVASTTARGLSRLTAMCAPRSALSRFFFNLPLPSFLEPLASTPTVACDQSPVALLAPALQCPATGRDTSSVIALGLQLAWLGLGTWLVVSVLVRGRHKRAMASKDGLRMTTPCEPVVDVLKVSQVVGFGVCGVIGVYVTGFDHGLSYAYALANATALILPSLYVFGMITRTLIVAVWGIRRHGAPPLRWRTLAMVLAFSGGVSTVTVSAARKEFVGPVSGLALTALVFRVLVHYLRVKPSTTPPLAPAEVANLKARETRADSLASDVSDKSDPGKFKLPVPVPPAIRSTSAMINKARRRSERAIRPCVFWTATVFIVVGGTFSIANNLQLKGEFGRPPTIHHAVYDSQIVFDHAVAVKLQLDFAAPGALGTPLPPAPHASFSMDGDDHLSYSICKHRWFSDTGNPLSIVDFSLLSLIAYFDPLGGRDQLDELLRLVFPANDALGPSGNRSELESLFEVKYFPPSITPWGPQHNATAKAVVYSSGHWFELYSKEHDLSVVVVAGTDIGKLNDVKEDVEMWAEPALFKVMSTLFPTVRLWPNYLTSHVVATMNSLLALFGLNPSEGGYYREVVQHVKSINSSNIVLTGHSLGGGLAHIAGSLTNHPSVTFSPPGVLESRRKFNVDGHRVHSRMTYHNSVSVVPDLDPVPLIDRQTGLRQQIRCGNRNPLWCHAVETTTCELLRSCGDPRGRFTSCSVLTGPHAMLPVLAHYFMQHVSHPDPVLFFVLAMLYVGGLVPLFSGRAEKLLRRGRLEVSDIHSSYTRSGNGDETDTDTDGEYPGWS